MKKLNSSIRVISALAIATVFASCGSMSNNSFTKAKYYNFGHNDPTVSFNKTSHEANKEVKASVTASAQANKVVSNNNITRSSEVAPKTQNANKITASQKRTRKQLEQKIVTAINSKLSVANVNEVKSLTLSAPDEIQNSKATEGEHSIPLIVMVILALFLSPLAVFLHDNVASTRFWIVLLLWLLGGGFYFGYGTLGGLLILAAIIWALVIVLGSAGSI